MHGGAAGEVRGGEAGHGQYPAGTNTPSLRRAAITAM